MDGRLELEGGFEGLEGGTGFRKGSTLLTDATVAVKDGGMVAAAEKAADLGKGLGAV